MAEEKKPHFLDLKIPLGCLITFYGILLSVYGIVTDPEMYRKSLDIDINLLWGLIMLGIGIIILIAAYRTRTKNTKPQLF